MDDPETGDHQSEPYVSYNDNGCSRTILSEAMWKDYKSKHAFPERLREEAIPTTKFRLADNSIGFVARKRVWAHLSIQCSNGAILLLRDTAFYVVDGTEPQTILIGRPLLKALGLDPDEALTRLAMSLQDKDLDDNSPYHERVQLVQEPSGPSNAPESASEEDRNATSESGQDTSVNPVSRNVAEPISTARN
eukprot:GHVU01083707.1.p1 GENE.GHVU01083707.1~~GHVU01083707.1.p1  ORF type:complete len:202 (+),score=15.71 GHVU01083707.1:33-608(+)